MSEAYQLLQKGLAALAAGHSDEAIVPLERAKRLHPENSSICEALGQAYFRLRFYDRSVKEFESIIEREPLDDYAHFCLGKCYERLGVFHLSSRHYKLARSLNPGRRIYADTLDRFIDKQELRDSDLLNELDSLGEADSA